MQTDKAGSLHRLSGHQVCRSLVGGRMKKVEIKHTHKLLGGTICVSYTYKFTEEEKRQIESELRSKDKIAVQKFIGSLEEYCRSMRHILDGTSKAELRILKEDILTCCKKTLRHLKNIEESRIILVPSRITTFMNLEDSRFTREMETKARYVTSGLEDFIEALEKNLKAADRKRGRKSADYNGLIKHFAIEYYKYIRQIPTTYDSGPFTGIVRIALEALGLPSIDPSRKVRAALKKLAREREERGLSLKTSCKSNSNDLDFKEDFKELSTRLMKKHLTKK